MSRVATTSFGKSIFSAAGLLGDLPAPPPGKFGWPWTIEVDPRKWEPQQNTVWPRLSVVVPSYNQGIYIEETIRSVILQNYPNTELIIVDGGSSDETVDVIKKYERWIAWWCSEKDSGQTHAINKGFRVSTGSIRAYLNSDDYYLPRAFETAVKSYLDEEWDLFVGRHVRSDERFGIRTSIKRAMSKMPYPYFREKDCPYDIAQETTFWRTGHVADQEFNENYRFCMDYEWFSRISRNANIAFSSQLIGFFRVHSLSKTSTMDDIRIREHLQVETTYDRPLDPQWKSRVLAEWRVRNVEAVIKSIVGGSAMLRYRHPG